MIITWNCAIIYDCIDIVMMRENYALFGLSPADGMSGSNKGVIAFMVHEVQMGKLRKRMSFSRIDEVLNMPNLIEVQKNSYRHFLTDDLKEVLADVSPITDYSDNLVLEFVDYSLDSTPKNSVERCRERDWT